MVFEEMASPFRAPQSDDAVLDIGCGDTEKDRIDTESTSSPTQVKAEENQSVLKNSFRNPTMFFRRRIVLLSLALLLSILIITLTIIGVLMSSASLNSRQDLTETETTKAKDQHAVKEIIEHETTIKVPAVGTRIDKSDTVEDMEILFSSPVPASTADSSESGSGQPRLVVSTRLFNSQSLELHDPFGTNNDDLSVEDQSLEKSFIS